MGIKKTTATALLFASILLFSSGDCGAREIVTLNFDFGNESDYSGDDGVLSSAGGTHWNHISKQALFDGFFQGETYVDEFGATSFGGVFTQSFFEDWEETSSSDFAGPRSDGLSFDAQQSVGATISFVQVRQFEEMVIYFTGPLEGGFVSFPGSTDVITPFDDVLGFQTQDFPGVENRDFIRIVEPPITSGGLGEAPVITIVLTNPEATISAVQLRGEFVPAPEPSSGVMLLLSLFAVKVRRKRI
jgi:hypothetical protein